MAIELTTLGTEHPDVAASYGNMGNSWSSKGEYEKALELYKQCLAIRLKTLGAEHPDVIAVAKNAIKLANENGLSNLIPDWIRSLDS